MTKKQVFATLALSTLALAQAGLVSADETTISPIEPSTPVETVTAEPSEPSLSVETPVELPTDQTTPVDPTPSVLVETTEEPVPTDPVITDPSTLPTTEEPQTTENDVAVTDPSQSDTSAEQAKDTSGDNLDLPSEQPKTSDQANQEGASQVGTLSSSTGQVVQNVTADAPVKTNTGASIISTQNGQLVLSDGSTVAPEAIGAVTNSDKTITVTKADGTKATLPETGEETNALLSFLGASLLGLTGFLWRKKTI